MIDPATPNCNCIDVSTGLHCFAAFRCLRLLMRMSKSKIWLFLLALASGAWAGIEVWKKLEQNRLSSQDYEPPPPGMVFVPAGEFLMGSNDAWADEDEKPLRKVFLPAFYIDRCEVSNRRYKEFKKDHVYPPGEDDLPVTFVLKHEAEEYCRWAGRRLPTNAEWEKAARGTDGRIYPWGNELPTQFHANMKKEVWNNHVVLTPVGMFEDGKSPYGIYDMAGNVWEWVNDWYHPHYYKTGPLRNPTGPPLGD